MSRWKSVWIRKLKWKALTRMRNARVVGRDECAGERISKIAELVRDE